MKENLKYSAVRLTNEQMEFIEEIVPRICERGMWEYRVCAAGLDHVHSIVASPNDPETIRRLMKRWLGQELDRRWKVESSWKAECGSIRWIGEEEYLASAIRYVARQRATKG